jgi:hypothetical protein
MGSGVKRGPNQVNDVSESHLRIIAPGDGICCIRSLYTFSYPGIMFVAGSR